MSQTMNDDLNVIANSDLEITYLDGDLAVIQKLDDEPNDVGGLTSAQLKAKFDQAGLAIQSYLNNTLIPELLAADATEAARAAAEAARETAEAARAAAEAARAAAEQDREDATSGIVAQAAQKAQEAAASAEQAAQTVLGTIPDGSIATAKLAAELQTVLNRAENCATLGADGILAEAQRPTVSGIKSDDGEKTLAALLSETLHPQIIVTAPNSLTVTCSKGTTFLTAREVGETWIFTVPEYGEWLVSSGPVSKMITVDAVKIYHVSLYEQLVNYTMLYDTGDECTDVTGGWTADKYSEKNAQYLNVNSTHWGNNDGNTPTVYTNSAVDFSGYKELHSFFDNVWYGYVQNASGSINLSTVSGGYVNSGVLLDIPSTLGIANNLHISGDVSGLSAPVYVKHCGYFSNPHIKATWAVKSDHYADLAEVAGIEASSMDDLIANSDTLLNNQNAVIYMLSFCTGDFMTAAIFSSTFLTALNNSPYKELVYANEHWAKFLAMVA